MKRYWLILLTAVMLSGCEGSKTREFIDPDPPHLTTMTMTTTVPVDTYSEYMETYTPTESTTLDSNRFYYQGALTAQGIYVDTMATFPTVGPVPGVSADTPMTTTVPPLSEAEEQSTETVTTDLPELPEEGAETVTATVQTVEGVPNVPGALVSSGTWGVPMAPADTVYSNTGSHTAGSVYQDTAFSNNVTGYTGTVPAVAPDTMYKNTSATTDNGGTE